MAPTKRIPLRGSERQPVAGFRSTGAANPNESIEVTVTLHPQSPIDEQETIHNAMQPKTRIIREQVENRLSASAASIDRVKTFATEHNLKVESADPLKRTMVISGTVSAFNKAFGVSLERFEKGTESYRGRTGPVHIPEEIGADIESVLGLDDRPQARPHFRRRQQAGGVGPRAAGQSFTADQIAQLYDFPPGQDGSGECIALIELGGGYRTQDLTTYFNNLKLAVPKVTAIGVDGASNAPTGSADGPDGEVVLDIEVAGAVAPGATIAAYFAPNTDRGFLDAIKQAIHDKTHMPSMISISWGAAEAAWTAQAMTAFDSAFQTAAAMGITVCVACGDNGSSDGESSGNHVDFPASSPFALACGGTKLVASGNKIHAETVWNDGAGQGATGGGYSEQFPVPTWQKTVNMKTGRGVPDVAGDADPQTGYEIFVDGTQDVFGGTSAVAPLWAGLIARMNQALGSPVGYLNPVLYSGLGSDFHDVTQGNNGSFKAAKGWDPCTGFGSPDGQKLLAGLRQKSAKAA